MKSPAVPIAKNNKDRLLPSFAELFPALLLLAVFGRPTSWQSLLADGDTGWHIRTGDFILAHHRVPWTDLFSFSRPPEPWFAWEWLSDVFFSVLYAHAGLDAVAGLAAVLRCCSAGCLVAWLLRRQVGM